MRSGLMCELYDDYMNYMMNYTINYDKLYDDYMNYEELYDYMNI